jgi:hypothetical protein
VREKSARASVRQGQSSREKQPERRSIRAGYYWKPKHDPDEAKALAVEVPRSYEELIRNYHRMVLGVAEKAGLSGQDAEDAAQTIELRFFLRDGLADYDPEKLWDPPEGLRVDPVLGVTVWDDGKIAVPRTAAFVTMYKTYVLLSMRGERDKAHRWYRRHVGEDELEGAADGDVAETVCSAHAAATWLGRAARALRDAGMEPWATALVALARGEIARREDWARILGVKVRSVGWAQSELRARLVRIGFGPETISA